MKKITISIVVISILCFGFANGSLAILMEKNFLGTNDILLDTDTGLEWLDWNLTYNFNHADVLASSYVTTHGFTWASPSQIGILYANAGIPDVPGETVNNFAPVSALMSQLGVSPAVIEPTADGFNSVLITNQWGTYQQAATLNIWEGKGYAKLDHYTWNTLTRFPVVGHALVRSVPEPATMLLLGTGFLGIAVLGRKRFLKK